MVAGVLMDQCFTHFGMPNELHSDHGQNFESVVCQFLSNMKTRTIPLSSKCDGTVKFIWFFGQELAKFRAEGHSKRDLKLLAVLMAYWCEEHEFTGYTPAKIMDWARVATAAGNSDWTTAC